MKIMITTIRTSPELQFHWKGHFRKNPINFRINADFEADIEIYKSNIGNKTNVYKQNPILNGYHIISELNDFLRTRSDESPLSYDYVDWFVEEIIKKRK